MYCTNCGAKLEPEARFCAQCGTRVVKDGPAEQPAEQAAPAAVSESVTEPVDQENVCEVCKTADISGEQPPEPQNAEPCVQHECCCGAGEPEQEDTQPTAEEPAPECPCCAAAEEPSVDEPSVDEPSVDEPSVDEPSAEEPKAEAPAQSEPYIAPDVAAAPVYGGENKRPSAPRRTSVGGHVACTICAIFLALFLIVTYSVAVVQHVFDGDSLVSFVNELDPSRLDIDGIASSGVLSDYGIVYDDGDTLLDVIYNTLGDDNITKAQLEAILNNKKISAAAGKLISDTIERMLAGKRGNVLKTSDIMKLIEDNRKAIESVVGYKLTDGDMLRIEGLIEENFGEAIAAVSVDNIDLGAADVIRGVARTVLSKWLLVALCVICLILSVLIIVCARSFMVGLNYVGVPFIVVGLFWSISMGALLVGIPGIPFKSLASAVGSLVTKPMFIAVSMFLFGVVCIGIGIIIRGASARKARRA